MIDVEQMVRDVYTELGPGYSERVYHNAMEVLLREMKVPYETERHILVHFRNHIVGQLRADIIVDGHEILEFKAVKTINEGAELQARNYLHLTGLRTAYVVNFPPHPDREVEIRKISVRPLEGELSKAFDKIHSHHRSVSADLTRLLPRAPELELGEI